MKLFVAVGLLASLAIASSASTYDFGFTSERQYRYQFAVNTTIRTAFASTNSKNDYLTNSELILAPSEKNEQLILAKIVKTDSENVNKQQSSELAQENQYEDFLALPFRFEYVNGLVGKVEFVETDPVWSRNMKKSFINMLQIALHEKKNQHSEADFVFEKLTTDIENVEETLMGKCRVVYSKVSDEENTSEWFKYVNHTQCQLNDNRVSERDSDDFSSVKIVLQKTSDENKWYPRQVTLKSFQHSKLFSETAEPLFTSYSWIQLNYVESQEKVEKFDFEGKMLSESIIYNQESDDSEEIFGSSGIENMIDRSIHLQNYVEIASNMIVSVVDRLDKHAMAEDFIRFVRVLRWCNEADINNIEKFWMSSVQYKNAETDVQLKIRDFFKNSLATAGTRPAIRVLLQKIYKKQMTTVSIVQLLKIVSQSPFTSELIAEDIFSFCESDQAKRSSVIRQSCWLSYGALLGSFRQTKQNVKNFEQIKQRLIENIFNKLNSASDRYDQTLYLKAIANAGYEQAIPMLEKMISDNKLHYDVRVEAINALRRMTLTSRIQKALLNALYDQNEHQEIRMAAWTQILRTQPNEAVLLQIFKHLKNNTHMQSYVFSSLKTISESELPHEREFALQLRKLLNHFDNSKELYSQQTKWTHFGNAWEAGYGLQLSSIFSNNSILPQEIRSHLEVVFGQTWEQNLFQIGMTQRNAELFVQKLIDIYNKEGIENLITRQKRSSVTINPFRMVQDIIAKFRITPRTVNTDESRALIYFRYRDLDFAFVPLDLEDIPETIKNLFQDGKIRLGAIEELVSQNLPFRLNSMFNAYEFIVRKPSVTGIPLVYSARLPVILSLNGSIRFEFTPVKSDKWTGLNIHFEAEPTLILFHQIELLHNSQLIQLGSRFNQHLVIRHPINLKTEANWENGDIKLRYTMKTLEKSQNIFQLRSHPVYFKSLWEMNSKYYPEAQETTVYYPTTVAAGLEEPNVYFKNSGFDLETEGKWIHPRTYIINEVHPFYYLFSDFYYNVNFLSTGKSRDYVLVVKSKLFELIEGMLHPDFEEYYKSYEKNVEELEHFNAYFKELKIEKAYKHSFAAHIESSISPETKIAEMIMSASCDDKFRYCRWNTEIDRMAIESESRDWKLRVFGQSLYPRFINNIREMVEDKHRDFTSFIRANWGSDEKYFLNMNFHGMHSEKQRLWLNNIKNKQVLSQLQKSYNDEEILAEAGRLDMYRLQANYRLAPLMEVRVQELFALFKLNKWFESTVEHTNTVSTGNNGHRLSAQLVIEPTRRQYFHFGVEYDNERVSVNNLRLPFNLPSLNTIVGYKTVENVGQLVSNISPKFSAMCSLRKTSLSTFDGVSIPFPTFSGYTLFAKDCSNLENPRFMVLGNRNDKNEFDVKIVNPKTIIEFTRDSSKDIYYFLVNGKQINQKSYSLYNIQRTENGFIVTLPEIEVHLQFGNVLVNISPLYMNKQCGICGHFDKDTENEMVLPDNTVTQDYKKFLCSYNTIKGCSIDDEKKFIKTHRQTLNKKVEYSGLYEEKTGEESYKVIEEAERFCVSLKPMKNCFTGAAETKEMNVIFKCIPKTDRRIKEVMEAVRQNKLTSDLFDNMQSFVTKYSVPVECF